MTAAYQDLLQEIVEKKTLAAQQRELAKRTKKPVWKPVLAVVLPPIAAAVWIFQPFASPPPTTPRPPDERGAWRMALTDAALRIREWRDSAGTFPADLPTAGVLVEGVIFERLGPESFRLQTFTGQGSVAVWMDGDAIGYGTQPPPPPNPDSLVPQGAVLP